MLKKIISCGQTGADQAALDVAISLGIPHGGWIPKGRKIDTGILPDKYKLKETDSSSHLESTKQNIIDSDGTLIISHGRLTGGLSLTLELAKQYEKDWFHIDLEINRGFRAAQLVKSWIESYNIEVLNVSGLRTNKDPNIYGDTVKLLKAVNQLFLLDCCESSFL